MVVSLLPFGSVFFSKERIAEMRRTCVFVHAGSGGVVDEVALARALRDRALGGAALDTYTWEPPQPDHPLVALCAADPAANVVLTPHIASVPMASDRRGDYAEIERFLRGEPLEYRIA